MTKAEIQRLAYLLTDYFAVAFALLMIAGCNADCASPFEKPDTTTQPVNCQQSGCAS